MRVKLFTHTDLDGVGCSIIAMKFFKPEELSICYCNYNDVNEIIKEFYLTEECKEYDSVLITDISVNEDVAEIINNHSYNKITKGGLGTTLLDHHQTALWLNKYSWSHVKELNLEGNKTSGTELLFDFLYPNGSLHCTTQLVWDITLYDSWRWMNDFPNPYMKSKKMNDLYYLLGRNEFIKQMLNGKDVDDFEILLDVNKQRIDRLVDKKRKQMRIAELDKYKFGFVFSEECSSEIGNTLSRENPELDFIAILDITTQGVSLRTTKADINLGLDVVKQFGGGGHPQASGCPMTLFWTVLLNRYLEGEFE